MTVAGREPAVGRKKLAANFLMGRGRFPCTGRRRSACCGAYFRLSLDLGRLPSILGGEVFRGSGFLDPDAYV